MNSFLSEISKSQYALLYDVLDKEHGDWKDHDYPFGHLYGGHGEVLRSYNLHNGFQHAYALRFLPIASSLEHMEVVNDPLPTLDSYPQKNHISVSTDDSEKTVFHAHERLDAFQESKTFEFFQRHREVNRQSYNSWVCLLWLDSFERDALEFFYMSDDSQGLYFGILCIAELFEELDRNIQYIGGNYLAFALMALIDFTTMSHKINLRRMLCDSARFVQE